MTETERQNLRRQAKDDYQKNLEAIERVYAMIQALEPNHETQEEVSDKMVGIQK